MRPAPRATCLGLLAVLGAALLGGCATTPSFSAMTGLPSPSTVLSMGDSDLERTWRAATVALPPFKGEAPPVFTMDTRRIERQLGDARGSRGFPTVIYLHGCTGLGAFEFLASLASAGFVVVAPDSMARRYRPLQCNPWSHTGTGNLFVFDFRMAELTFALQQLRSFDWVDRDNLFVVGVSEGGVPAALYRGDDVRARVIAQWTCQGPPIVRGIAAPPATPVLAVMRAGDPWYDRNNPAGAGNCGEFLSGRPNSRAIVLPPGSGDGHDVLRDAAAVRDIVGFLVAEARRPLANR